MPPFLPLCDERPDETEHCARTRGASADALRRACRRRPAALLSPRQPTPPLAPDRSSPGTARQLRSTSCPPRVCSRLVRPSDPQARPRARFRAASPLPLAFARPRPGPSRPARRRLSLTMSALPSPVPAPATPEEVETYSTWALTILCSLLIGALWMSYYLQVRKIRAIHETVVSIFAGTSRCAERSGSSRVTRRCQGLCLLVALVPACVCQAWSSGSCCGWRPGTSSERCSYVPLPILRAFWQPADL